MGFKARRWYVWRAWHVGDPVSHHAQHNRFFSIEALFRDHIHSFHFCFPGSLDAHSEGHALVAAHAASCVQLENHAKPLRHFYKVISVIVV